MKKVDLYEKYDDFQGSGDLEKYAEQLVDYANEKKIPIEQSPEKVKHMIKTDIRDAIPPQLFKIVGLISQVIEEETEK